MFSIEKAKLARMYGDWVCLEKEEAFDGAQKIGNIYVPQTTNTNIMESKIGRIISAGPGLTDGKGRYRRPPLDIGELAYYTRYGKETFEGADDRTYVFTRDRGVIAYVDLDGQGNISRVRPRYDRLLLREIKVGEHKTDTGVILLDERLAVDDYRRWEVVAVGPGEPRKTKTDIDYENRVPTEARPGDIVWAAPQSGVRISGYVGTERQIYWLTHEAECVMIEQGG
jgi:co-chaperonin GroES (HSP10)